jgi:hypothetical protein
MNVLVLLPEENHTVLANCKCFHTFSNYLYFCRIADFEPTTMPVGSDCFATAIADNRRWLLSFFYVLAACCTNAVSGQQKIAHQN